MEDEEMEKKERGLINKAKARELINNWKSPENFKLTAKQTSLRFPIIIMAKISALCELHAKESKSKIVADLLSLAFELIESELEDYQGEVVGLDDDQKPVYEHDSEKARYYKLTRKYIEELKKEAGIETGGKEARKGEDVKGEAR